MDRFITRVVEMAAITIALVAIAQQMEKPPEKRTWHGDVTFVPYDFRLPSLRRLRDAFWNPYESRLLTPAFWGIGWSVNFHRLLEGCGIMRQGDVSEEQFLVDFGATPDRQS